MDDGAKALDEGLIVAVHSANKGLFVFTACSHAGLINVLTHAAERFPGISLFGVLGGFHLAGPNEAIIPETVDALGAFDLQVVAAAHCTARCRSCAITSTSGLNAFLERPIEGEWPYLWLDATYLKQCEGEGSPRWRRLIAVAVNTDGRREIIRSCA